MMVRLALLFLLLVTTAAVAQETADGAVEREREQLLSRLERVREQAKAAESRAAALDEELVNLSGDEARLRQRLEETGARVAELEGRIAADELALEGLTDRQATIRHELAGKRAELATVLMALQRIGRRPPPALLGDADGPLGTVRGAILLNAVVPALDGEAQALATTLAEAARLEGEERDRWARVRGDLEAVTAERRRLTALGAELERRRALSAYERERAAAEAARLGEEAGSVEALLRGLAGAGVQAPAGLGFEARRGALPLPVAGTVVSEYGDPIAAGGVTEGRTVAALPESSVFAPVDGTVLFSSPFRGYGHVLILDAGDGYHMVLAGLAETAVSAGDAVTAGTPLGRMGVSGERSAVASAGTGGSALLGARPALYVELRKDGTAIDSHGWWQAASVAGKGTGG